MGSLRAALKVPLGLVVPGLIRDWCGMIACFSSGSLLRG